MKQSSTTPHTKKLVQARLPFQILSPGVKNPEVTPELRKRKANDPSNEVTDVKENQGAPVEKKPKVVNSNDAGEEETNQNNKKVENEEEKMEVDIQAKQKECKALSSHLPVSKGKSKTNLSQKPNKKSRKSNHTGKACSSFSMKKEIIDKSRNSESAAVDIIDLCDSPCKTENSSEKLSNVEDLPKLNIESFFETKDKKQDELNLKTVKELNKEREEDKNNTQESELGNKEEVNSELSATVTNIGSATLDKSDSISEKTVKLNNQSTTDTERSHTNETSLKATVTNDSSEQTNIKASPDLGVDSISNILNNSCTNEKEPSNSCLEPKTPSGKSQSSLDDLVSRTSSLNESSTSFDVSLSSDCSTPSANIDTPKLSKKSASTTPRRLTPKQLLKMKEREAKLKERERLKQEKEKKKAEEKEEKLKLKQEKDEEKLRQKQEKEEEKRKEKEDKERKKQAEIAQKNEEKRLREEEKRAKEEEKKKKEEEEKKKKEEKKLKEELKEADKRKSAQAFASFFLKSESKPANGDEENEISQEISKFQPFEVKNDMRLAPLVRSQLTEDRKQILDDLFDSSTNKSTQTLYLTQLRQASYVKGEAGKTWPAPDETDDDVIIIESEKPNGEVEADSKECEKKPEKKRQRAKLLQFHENRRPPYWGTWRKKSKFIRPRAPLNEDKAMFEYDIDSDDEWEEPEDGESLRGSENEESQDEQYEEDNDMFVPHGYLSDEEGQDDLDDKSPEAMKLKLKFLQQEFEAERNEKQEKLKPRLIGCVWFCNSETEPSTVGSHIAELFLARRAVWDGSPLPLKLAPPVPITPPTPSETGENEESRGTKRKLVPESLIPTMIRTIHGSRKKLTRLLAELLDPCEADQRPSKRCFVDKVREIASWTMCTEIGHRCWYVKEEVRQAYNLMDLNISPLPPRVPTTPNANITKFTKVLTSDERLRLLSYRKESSKPSTPSVKQSAVGVKNVNPKLPTAPKASPAVKKRIPLTTVGPVQGVNSLRHFVSVRNEDNSKTANSQTNDTGKNEEKVKKRITPITLTSSVTKPSPPPPSEDGCIVLSD